MPWPPNAANATSSGTRSGSLAGGPAWPNMICACCRSGLSTSWMRQPLAGTGTRSAGCFSFGPSRSPLNARASCAASAAGSTSPDGREDQVAAHELLAEVRRDLVGGHVVEVGARSVGRVAVGVVAVQVLREEARAQRLVVVAGLVDLRLDLAPRALHLGGGELRPHDRCRPGWPGTGSRLRASTCPTKRTESGSVSTSSVAPSASSASSICARVRPPAPRRASSGARLVSPSRWCGSVDEPPRAATTTYTSGMAWLVSTIISEPAGPGWRTHRRSVRRVSGA